MPRKAKELSAKAVAALKEPGSYAVGGIDGLYLTVAVSGARSWLFRYSVKTGTSVRRREMGLGGFPKLPLSEAREKARAAQAELNAGGDPIDARNAVKRVPTFWEVAEDLLATVEASGKNAKHRQQWRNTLKGYAAPLHAKPVDCITTDDVASVLAPIWQAKPETASRLRGRIERVLSIAKAKGLRAGENPAAWRDNLEPILGKRRRLTRGHHEALSYADIAAFAGALRQCEGVAALALEFTILTAARTGEVIGARWPEFDLVEKVWAVPAVRMKAGREHRVPLTDRAVAILEAVKKIRRDGEFVFPGRSAESCLSNMAMAAVLKRMKRDDITVHGFRSCFRDWAGEVSSFPNEVCEMALAHAVRNKAEAAYRRGHLFEKRRAMMQAWADYCEPKTSTPQPVEQNAFTLPRVDAPKRKRGRQQGSFKPSEVQKRALQYALAGAPTYSAAAAALTEKVDAARVWAVQSALSAVEAGPFVPIDEIGKFQSAPNPGYVPPTEEDVENARRWLEYDSNSTTVEMHPDDPAADTDDDGNDYLWIPSAFLEHGKRKLREAGVKLADHDSEEFHALKRYAGRHKKRIEARQARAAEAYCKAIEEYAERHGFKRVSDDWGGWRFDASQDQLEAMYAYARAAADEATRGSDRA
jgi:integrase